MSSALGVLTRAAHPTQRRPDGTLRSRHDVSEVETSGWRPDARKSSLATVGPSVPECSSPQKQRHELVRWRATGQCPTIGQRLVDAVAGDQSTDRHVDTTSVSPASLVFLGWRLMHTHLQAGRRKLFTNAQCRKRWKGSTSAYREQGKVKRSPCNEARQAPEQFSIQRCWRNWADGHLGLSCAISRFCTCP